MFCNIKIFNNGKEQRLRAMIDTGNLLKDPITNSPVVIIEKSKLLNILPEEILENTKKIINGQYEFSDEYLKYASKFRVLPFSSLGKQNGMLLGIKAEYIKIKTEEQETKKTNVIIGIYDKSLTKRGEYQALIGIELL